MADLLTPDVLILRDVPSAGDAVSLPREFRERRVRDLWIIVNEPGVRVVGPVDGHNAERQERGHAWQQTGDRLGFYGGTRGVSYDLYLRFDAAVRA